MKMQSDHEAFLLDHVKKMGFIFVIDLLKDKFPKLSHEEACSIFDEFEQKYSEDGTVKQANAQLKQMGNEIGGQIEQMLKDKFK